MSASEKQGAQSNGKHSALRVEKREGVAILWIDVPGETLNTLRLDLIAELERKLQEVGADPSIRACVLASGKSDSFIAGADISMLEGVRSAEEGAELSRRAQAAMDRVATFSKPVVAAIHGVCLGGGLELALACHGRVASTHDKTRLGLPEVQLGILPGAGGTQRLPRLIPLQEALDLLLSGKQLRAAKAKKLGLVDDAVEAPILLEVACRRALNLATTGKAAAKKADSFDFQQWLLSGNPLGRYVVFEQALKQVRRKTKGNYPAPEAILAVVRKGLEKGLEQGLKAEAEAFGRLLVSPEAGALIGIFRAQTALKKDSGLDGDETKAEVVEKVGVLGAGLMGSGIAYVSANAGMAVRLRDRDDASLLRGLSQVRRICDERLRRKSLTRSEAESLMTRVTATPSLEGFRSCEVVIEAVFEDLEVKKQVLREVEALGNDTLIFASNTSSLPIGQIAAGCKRPENVIGMHYFSPVDRMPLLEVIVTPQTAPQVTATAVELGKRQGKTVIVVGDGAGFYTTRVLVPFLNEAAFMLHEGVAVEQIDRALVEFGFPVGPLKLSDEVGIDVGYKVGKIVHQAFGDRLSPPPGLERLVKAGRLGRKNGKGFYLYPPHGKGVDSSVYADLGVQSGKELAREEIAWRCTLQLVNESVRCLEEGVLRSARDGDIGAVFGLGFPPFRGGPFALVESLGARQIVERLEAFAKQYGERFAPASLLVEMAGSGKRSFQETKKGEKGGTPSSRRAGSNPSSL